MNKTWQTPPTMEEWCKLIDKDDPVIVEVGCNDGTDTQRFLDAFPGCRIYCFEPDPRAIRRFKANVHDKRVTLIEKAVTHHAGPGEPWYASHGKVQGECDVALESLEDWDLSGSICKPTGHIGRPGWCSWKQECRVECTSLDRYFDSLQIDLLWIDAQGAEGGVLAGAKMVLPLVHLVYVEFYDQNFNQQGFDCPALYEGQVNLVELICLLGIDWRLLGFYDGTNALFQNRIWR